MKKIGKILIYVCIIALLILSAIFLYRVFGKQTEEKQNYEESSVAEIKYFEDQFVSLFNQLNNISFDNYKISTSKIEENNSTSSSKNSSSSNSSADSNSSSENNSSGNSDGNTSSNNSGENSSSGNSSSNISEGAQNNSNQTKQQFKIQGTGILTGDKNINWEQMQNDVEIMYTKLYSCTLSLYQKDINKDDILNFNKEFDNLTVSVKEKSKEKTLDSLSKLYGHMPEFMDACSDDEKDKIVIKTKNGILQAYSLLDKDEWDTMLDDVNSSAKEFGKMLTDLGGIESENQYNVNKTYIMINELASAVNLKDKDVFLIKYKNVMEELQNL